MYKKINKNILLFNNKIYKFTIKILNLKSIFIILLIIFFFKCLRILYLLNN